MLFRSGGAGITNAADGPDAGPVPIPLVAVAVQVYVLPFVTVPAMTGLVAPNPVPVAPPFEEVQVTS